MWFFGLRGGKQFAPRAGQCFWLRARGAALPRADAAAAAAAAGGAAALARARDATEKMLCEMGTKQGKSRKAFAKVAHFVRVQKMLCEMGAKQGKLPKVFLVYLDTHFLSLALSPQRSRQKQSCDVV